MSVEAKGGAGAGRSAELSTCTELFDAWMDIGVTAPRNLGVGEQIDCWNAFRKGWHDKRDGRKCYDGCGYHGASRVAYLTGREQARVQNWFPVIAPSYDS